VTQKTEIFMQRTWCWVIWEQ